MIPLQIPQVQLTYKRLSTDDLVETSGTKVTHDLMQGVESIIGTLLVYEMELEEISRVKTYLGINWIYDDAVLKWHLMALTIHHKGRKMS